MSFWIKNSLLLLLFILISCQSKEKEPITWNKEKSTELGKDIAKEEEISIELYLDQHNNLQFKPTGTGLRVAYLKHGDGAYARPEMTAEVRFKITLLDGTVCYESDLDRDDFFKIDHDDIESGIQEGIKLMRIGDKCRFVMPSHLAHGLLGDMDKIPPLSVIVVDIELKELK